MYLAPPHAPISQKTGREYKTTHYGTLIKAIVVVGIKTSVGGDNSLHLGPLYNTNLVARNGFRRSYFTKTRIYDSLSNHIANDLPRLYVYSEPKPLANEAT